jgi:hypothetical protein
MTSSRVRTALLGVVAVAALVAAQVWVSTHQQAGDRLRPAADAGAAVRGVTHLGAPGGSQVKGGPTCAAPPLPPPTAPPGQPYGVPFVAAVDNVTILSGYNEFTAAARQYRSYSPWTTTLYGVTGWVTGWLDVPQLTVDTSASQITFCSYTVTPPSSSGTPPFTTEALYTLKSFQGSKTPVVVTTTNDPSKVVPPNGVALYASVTLTPVGTPQLKVTGVRPDGSLDLGGVIEATPTIALAPPLPPEVCRAMAPTAADLSTATAGPLPPSGPPAGDRDAAPQFTPAPVTGPLTQATATQTAYDFQVPAFYDNSSDDGICYTFNGGLAGFTAEPKGNPNYPYLSRYPFPPANPAIASDAGWTQIETVIQITRIGLPTGTPTTVPAGCRPSYNAPPYQLGFTGTFSAGKLQVGPVTVGGLTGGISGTFCGIAEVEPGTGGCPAQVVLLSPSQGQQFNPLGITFSVVPGMQPEIKNGSVQPGPLSGVALCPSPNGQNALEVSATADAGASTGLFGLSCVVGPVSIPLTGTLTGTPPQLTGTLNSPPFTVPAGQASATCPHSVADLLNSIAGLPNKAASLSITVTANTYAPSP